MGPVYPVYAVIAYFALAILLPVGWASWKTWRRARVPREVICPLDASPALVILDPRFAVKMHALGNNELRIRHCSRETQAQDCGRECLEHLGRVA